MNPKPATGTRTERDPIGEKQVPAGVLYGTSYNMNVNEVIANRASRSLDASAETMNSSIPTITLTKLSQLTTQCRRRCESVSYSNVAEEALRKTLSVYDVKVHVLSQGDRFDFADRAPEVLTGRAAEKLPEKKEAKDAKSAA